MAYLVSASTKDACALSSIKHIHIATRYNYIFHNNYDENKNCNDEGIGIDRTKPLMIAADNNNNDKGDH